MILSESKTEHTQLWKPDILLVSSISNTVHCQVDACMDLSKGNQANGLVFLNPNSLTIEWWYHFEDFAKER